MSMHRARHGPNRAVLLSPPRLVARFTRFAWHHRHHREAYDPADDVRLGDSELVSLLLDLFRAAEGPVRAAPE